MSSDTEDEEESIPVLVPELLIHVLQFCDGFTKRIFSLVSKLSYHFYDGPQYERDWLLAKLSAENCTFDLFSGCIKTSFHCIGWFHFMRHDRAT